MISKNSIGKFFVVSTPIGNLEDLTIRAIKTLENSDVVLCEDTRNSIKLLNYYKISKKLISYHEHSSIEKDEEVYKMLLEGKNVSIISDQGTPIIADPGSRLVKFLHSKGIKIETSPGVCSIINALVLSGISIKNFYFAGWMPRKKEERIKNFINIFKISNIIVFLETAIRLKKSILDIYETLLFEYNTNLKKLKSEFENSNKLNPQQSKKLNKLYKQKLEDIESKNPKNINIYIIREMTKIYEEVISGTIIEIRDILIKKEIKGELVLVFEKNY